VAEGKQRRECWSHSPVLLAHNITSMHVVLSASVVDVALPSQLSHVVFP